MITKSYAKEFLVRGLIFSGLGPIVLGIVYYFISLGESEFVISGRDMLLGVVSTYVIAFVHAGSSVFPIIESWSKMKAMLVQGVSIYSVYTIFYLINAWLPYKGEVILIYTICFVLGFLLIWLIVFLSTKKLTKRMNDKLNERLMMISKDN